MKKIVVLLLALSMMFALCGCDNSDYKKAQQLFENGQYDEAKEAFEKLGDYKETSTYLEQIQIEKNKLGVELIKSYFNSFGDITLTEEIVTAEEITFSGTVGEDSYELSGKVALQNNSLEHTIRFPKHSVKDLNGMDVKHLYWVFNNREQAYLSELALMTDLLGYSEAMSKMGTAEADSDTSVFLTNAWRVLFDSRSSEQVFQGWQYKMTIPEDSDTYEISAKYVG